jgi:hypothetical protein
MRTSIGAYVNHAARSKNERQNGPHRDHLTTPGRPERGDPSLDGDLKTGLPASLAHASPRPAAKTKAFADGRLFLVHDLRSEGYRRCVAGGSPRTSCRNGGRSRPQWGRSSLFLRTKVWRARRRCKKNAPLCSRAQGADFRIA